MRFSKRSPQSHRHANPVLLQDPDFPAPIPLPVESKQVVDFTDPSVLRHLPTARDGLTVMMPAVLSAPTQVLPVVEAPQTDLDATQVLPAVSEMLPPSVQHADPAKRTTTFVEDNDLEPQCRGQHVLAELKALPDPEQELAAVAQRVIADLGGPDTVAKDPARRESVRRFRHARDMQRTREARADAAVSSADAVLKSIHDMWTDWDDLLSVWNAIVCGQEAMDAGHSLAATYEANRQRVAQENARRVAEGQPLLDATATTFTREMAAELKQLIVRRATAGSAVSA